LVIGLAVGLAACDSTAASPQETVPATTTTRKPQFEDTGLRDVRMTAGRSLGYVQPETGSQILCQVLEKDAWEELLGGEIGRMPAPGPHPLCQIAFGRGLVQVQMFNYDDGLEDDTTIAGRPASAGDDGYTVALIDEALEPAPRNYHPEWGLLEVSVTTHQEGIEPGIAEKLLEEIVPLLTGAGDELPDIDDTGHVRYEKTPLVGHFVDQPMPVQALQLCTLVREELDVRVRGVEARDLGECGVDADGADDFTLLARHTYGDTFPDEVAGLPAHRTSGSIKVLLQEDAGTALWVTGDDAVEIAEQLIPLLTG
jgi:hypothetical protein